jgi:predicted dehydrogenase
MACAPDTFLGGGIQTARKLIDDGAIGKPVSAMAFMLSHGVESWHPSPAFYYKAGAGPMFDMGPYYLTALVNLLGPITRVAGMTRTTFSERLITSEPCAGTKIRVDVPTHHMGVMEFSTGAIGHITTSFDVWPYPLPCILVFGTESTLEVPDPNLFQGPVRIRSRDGKTYDEVPLTHSIERGRGTGVADLAYAIRSGRPHRATGALANHVVEVMEAFETTSTHGQHVRLTTSCERPAALPAGLPRERLDP